MDVEAQREFGHAAEVVATGYAAYNLILGLVMLIILISVLFVLYKQYFSRAGFRNPSTLFSPDGYVY